jgi:hypothetical protein
MNTKLLASALIAAAGFAAAPSFAGDNMTGEVGYVPTVSAAMSGVSRADVRSDYLAAQRHDALPAAGEGADTGAVAATQSHVSRAAVRAEAAFAVRHGQRIGGEV